MINNKNNDFIIQIEDLTLYYQDLLILCDIDCKIKNNSITAIVGPNGAGKSSLIKVMLDLIKPTTGSIKYFDNKNFKESSKYFSYVPQKEEVNWQFPTTVFDVALMGRYRSLGWFKRPKEKDFKMTDEILKHLDMYKYKDHHISELSGGQQQRVFLARSLLQEAQIYFLDEVFAGIDKKTEQIVVDTFKKLQQQGKTIIVVHHDLSTIEKYFDNVILINKKIIAYGKTSEVFTTENINKTFNNNFNNSNNI